jgi:molybdenum cofactor cytidylyltransferase
VAISNTPYGVLLAAGASHRFGDDNKLLADIGGAPLVRRVAERLLASGTAGLIVVTGFEADKVRETLTGLDIQFADNPDFSEGLASSLRCGIAALPKGVAGAMIVLADMPGITTALVDKLISTFQQEGGKKIVFPTRGGGDQGNPVIWPAHFFAELQTLTGDAGAKHLISAHEADTLGVPVDDEDALSDIDRPEDLGNWRS